MLYGAMDIRLLTPHDSRDLAEIDATIESSEYLHLDRSGEGMSLSLRLESRPLREKQITSNPIGDELSLMYRQVSSGADEGVALVAAHEGRVVAAILAQPSPAHGTMRLLDLRVDYDFRRQGLATALVCEIVARTREAGLRAVAAESSANNFPANQLLLKLGFDIAGVDARRHSNHDMVKESATLFWYAALD
jgi:ribosomal protein S18 acetylase RimI-like enzyme